MSWTADQDRERLAQIASLSFSSIGPSVPDGRHFLPADSAPVHVAIAPIDRGVPVDSVHWRYEASPTNSSSAEGRAPRCARPDRARTKVAGAEAREAANQGMRVVLLIRQRLHAAAHVDPHQPVGSCTRPAGSIRCTRGQPCRFVSRQREKRGRIRFRGPIHRRVAGPRHWPARQNRRLADAPRRSAVRSAPP